MAFHEEMENEMKTKKKKIIHRSKSWAKLSYECSPSRMDHVKIDFIACFLANERSRLETLNP